MFRLILAATAAIAALIAAYFIYSWSTDQGPVSTGTYVREKCLGEGACTMEITWRPVESYRMRLQVAGVGDCNPEAILSRTEEGYEGRWAARGLEDRSLTIKRVDPSEAKVVRLVGEGLTCDLANSGMNFIQGDYVRR